jgi:archaellum component FlaC
MKKSTKKETTLDDLAMMVAKGFASQDKRIDKLEEKMDKRFEQVDKRFEQVDQRFAHVDARFDRVEKDLQEVRSVLVARDEIDDLSARVKYLEMKMGIESGK